MSDSSTETDKSVTKIIEVIVPIGLIALLLVWCFNIIAPFIAPIVWGRCYRDWYLSDVSMVY